jgi:hypothetical protein
VTIRPPAADDGGRRAPDVPRWRARMAKISDDEIEDMVRDLIDNHFDDENRAAALEWLNKRIALFQAASELKLLD